MKQAQAEELIKKQLDSMNRDYMGVVFDEAIAVAFGAAAPKILYYDGPRQIADVERSFSEDLRGLKAALARPGYGVGDFEFTREGAGEAFDAFLVLGDGIYLICNNTQKSTAEITADPTWRKAQRQFVELAEAFRADPLV